MIVIPTKNIDASEANGRGRSSEVRTQSGKEKSSLCAANSDGFPLKEPENNFGNAIIIFMISNVKILQFIP